MTKTEKELINHYKELIKDIAPKIGEDVLANVLARDLIKARADIEYYKERIKSMKEVK